jgi:hypothetical protein
MPRLELALCRDFSYGEDGAIVDGRAVLARRDGSGNYHPQGDYTEELFQLDPLIRMELLDSFFGIECVRDDALGDAGVGFQISVDGGTSYLSWDGAAWTEDALRFSSPLTVEEFVSQLPVGGAPVLGLKMRLEAVGGETPIVQKIVLLYEMEDRTTLYGFQEDLERTLRRVVEDRVRVPIRGDIRSNGSAAIPVPTPMQTIQTVTGVYDLAADPGKQNNLLSGWSGTTITLTGPVASGTVLHVLGTASPVVILGAEPDYEESTLPFIYVDTIDIEENRFFRFAKVAEINYVDAIARVRFAPVRQRAMFLLRCAAGRRFDSVRIADAVKSAFQRDEGFRAIGSGQKIICLSFTPITGSDRIVDSMYEKLVSMTVEGWDFLDRQGYEEIPLVNLATAGYGSLAARHGIVEVRG